MYTGANEVLAESLNRASAAQPNQGTTDNSDTDASDNTSDESGARSNVSSSSEQSDQEGDVNANDFAANNNPRAIEVLPRVTSGNKRNMRSHPLSFKCGGFYITYRDDTPVHSFTAHCPYHERRRYFY